MKIRTNYVSNSSSSSFIICGNNVKQTLEKNILSDEKVTVDYWGYSDVNIGEVNEEILRQCNVSDDESVKNVIDGILYHSFDFYRSKIFWEKISNKSCNMFWGNVAESRIYDLEISGTFFELSDETKLAIEKAIMDKYNETKSIKSWDYCGVETKELQDCFNKQVETLFDKIKTDNKEVYAVSFGDNHGQCTGSMGWFVESEYLGQKLINNYLKSDFKIYVNNEH